MGDWKAEILECYAKLEYNTVDTKGMTQVLQMIKDFRKSETDKLELINNVKLAIERNIDQFHEGHIDTTVSMIEYLGWIIDIFNNPSYINKDEAVNNVLFTMQQVCLSKWVILLVRALYKTYSSPLDDSIIVFEDADLSALIDSLKIYKHDVPLYETSIWVQEVVREKLIMLMTETFENDMPTINGFLQTKHLLAKLSKTTYGVIAMWSENVTLLKCLAADINAPNILINSLHEFGTEALKEGKDQIDPKTSFSIPTFAKLTVDIKVHNHFYDGGWKEPIDKYYKLERDSGCGWAVATEKDVAICAKLALQGFNTWSSMAHSARIDCLRKLGANIRNDGDYELAKKIFQWATRPICFRGSVVQPLARKYELITTRKPIGVVILFQSNNEALFMRLVQALVAGNAVMIVSPEDTNVGMLKYCEKLSASGFPPNVVTLLLNCSYPQTFVEEYSKLRRFFICNNNQLPNPECNNDYQLMEMFYKRYTYPKHVYMPLM